MSRYLFLLLYFISFNSFAFDYDPDNGEEINEVCAGCHGEYAQGGKQGEYPRLAGLPASYLAEQLKLFRHRKRPNLPMDQYIDDRQMPDEDIYDITHYIAAIKLKTRLPPIDKTAPDFNAYDRLLASHKIMQIPDIKGDLKHGKKLYRRECSNCHGRNGFGSKKKSIPPLAGQYTAYLWRQVKLFHKKQRIHDRDDPDDEDLLDDFTHKELADIFAWLSTADD